MGEIEIGDFIRTNYGYIGRVKRIEFDKNDKDLKWYVFDKKEPNINIIREIYINKPYIINYSKQLIDLIEVGDIVNGMEVLDIYKPRDLWEPIEIRVDSRYTNFILAEDVKIILTKEQFEANCYKVGGEDGN